MPSSNPKNPQLESINLKKTYSLKENDNLIIASIEELTSEKNIAISGEVNLPSW